jgi:DNA-binding winged helix-turn-helix (wHTH) protein
MVEDRYTLTYRATEADRVMNWLKTGQSGCVISLRGTGKSNFLHFLRRKEIQQHYLGDDANFIFILIDLLALVERSEEAAYELILDRLLAQLRLEGIEEETLEKIMRSRDQFSVQRVIEQCVDVLCRQQGQRIVLLLDEFDAIFGTLAPSLFHFLRAIRDAHKDQLCYLVTVNDDLACLRDELTEVEHFYRLVSRNVCGLGPYNEADARQMIHYLASQRSTEFSEADTACLIELSGGHAGLLKTILSLLWDTFQEEGLTLAEIAPTLIEEPAVQTECWKVWTGLPEREQAVLQALIAGEQPDPLILRRLKRKGLVRKGQPEPLILSPLFTDFVRQQAPPSVKDIVISRSPRQVQLEGRQIETLSELEFEALSYLHEHRGQVCQKDELIRHVYGQQYGRMEGGVSDEALHTLIARLRAKIEPECGRPCYIITVRGQGYRFVEPTSSP